MRVWLTGGTGFVGSNIVHAAVQRGERVLTTVHSFEPSADAGYETDHVDMTDREAVLRSVAAFRPDVVIHCGILNDWSRMYSDREAAWEAYVGATRNTAGAAEANGAAFIVVSTDWVFDGTQGGADEETPPNPVNLYGVLKMASELVALERGGAVARVSGVNGAHRARPESPRSQDPGFGYFVASMVDALREGRKFRVWESDAINMRATPSLASESAEMILAIGEGGHDGVFHCCGGEAASRMELALLACDVFELDRSLLEAGQPPKELLPDAPIPYDTSITMPRTAEVLGRSPTPLRELLQRFRGEYR